MCNGKEERRGTRCLASGTLTADLHRYDFTTALATTLIDRCAQIVHCVCRTRKRYLTSPAKDAPLMTMVAPFGGLALDLRKYGTLGFSIDDNSSNCLVPKCELPFPNH